MIHTEAKTEESNDDKQGGFYDTHISTITALFNNKELEIDDSVTVKPDVAIAIMLDGINNNLKKIVELLKK